MWIYVALNASVLHDIKTLFSQFVQIVGLCCVPCLMLMTMIDQSIDKDIHAGLAFLFLGLELIYIFSVKLILLPSHPLYLSYFKPKLRAVSKYDSFLLFSTLVTSIEFYVANLDSNRDSFFHHSLQAASEYALSCGGVMYPFLLAKLLPDTTICLYTQKQEKS